MGQVRAFHELGEPDTVEAALAKQIGGDLDDPFVARGLVGLGMPHLDIMNET
ncbi:MAG TPA: hypothetical protein VGM88_11580 [Kofleriaceae bacterium]